MLNTQASVNGFPACDTIMDLTIDGADITDLSPLSSLTHILGTLRIENIPMLSNLNGLEGVLFANSVIIMSNNNLANLNGLINLKTTANLVIDNNSALSNINALMNLNVTNFLQIQNNINLSQCCVFKDEILALDPMNVMISNNSDPKIEIGCNSPEEVLADSRCDIMAVPTLGQWGLIILCLLLMTISLRAAHSTQAFVSAVHKE
jgi:hypothetical protein